MTNNNITIKGNVYDAETGNILDAQRSARTPAAAASNFHSGTQKSHTLQRKYIKKQPRTIDSVAPVRAATTAGIKENSAVRSSQRLAAERSTPPQIIRRSKRTRRVQDIRRSSNIAHFAKAKATTTTKPPVKRPATPETPDIAPTANQLEQTARQRQAIIKQQQTRSVLPSQVIKQQAIQEATDKMLTRQQRKEVKPAKNTSLWRRLVSVGSTAIAVLLLGAYFTYINMPALSTRIAASQAGINASYPNYQPSGYSLNGPVAYQQGSVIMKFAANGSNENFTLAQTRSEWDSSAVLENYIKPKSREKYTTTAANGLTIYSYGTHAAWVNAGILYTVDGNAELAPEQIQKIAASL